MIVNNIDKFTFLCFQALAQDQLRTLLEMKNAFHTDIDVKIYDGDTPREDRLWIRDNARLVSICF
jgi:DEAD/DEAH box helicase domain-containing protein